MCVDIHHQASELHSSSLLTSPPTIHPIIRPGSRLVLAGTIQFSTAIQLAKQRLSSRYPSLTVPKCRPLSPGEVLGCTAPVVGNQRAGDGGEGGVDVIVFVADGR